MCAEFGAVDGVPCDSSELGKALLGESAVAALLSDPAPDLLSLVEHPGGRVGWHLVTLTGP